MPLVAREKFVVHIVYILFLRAEIKLHSAVAHKHDIGLYSRFLIEILKPFDKSAVIPSDPA